MSKQEYANFIKQRDNYSEIAKKRLEKIYSSILKDKIPYFKSNANLEKKFPNLYQFNCYKMEDLFDLFDRNNGELTTEYLGENTILFSIRLNNSDIEEYLSLDSILAYASDREFKSYLAKLTEENKALTNFIIQETNNLKERESQDYQTYLKLKAKFEKYL